MTALAMRCSTRVKPLQNNEMFFDGRFMAFAVRAARDSAKFATV